MHDQSVRLTKLTLTYLLLGIAIVALWAIPVTRQVDLPNWHEFDDAAIAKNFVQEPSSILYPRIDWRRSGPGFVESEFPLYPWVMSECYRLGGIDVLYGRLVALLATVGALVLFMLLARSLLNEPGALAAVLLFGTNRITNLVSTALQPEAFMLFFYVAAVYGFLRWRATKSWVTYGWAIAAVSMAILEKSPAAHLGIFFVLVLFSEEGWGFLKAPANWCFAILSLLAPAMWYVHAHSLWLTYGNSLGISNENHWAGLDTLHSVKQWLGLFTIEGLFVFAAGGILLALLSVKARKSREFTIILMWCISVGLYYVVTIRTTGAFWASYYHVASIAPVALLCGLGVAYAMNASSQFRNVGAGAVISIGGLGLLWAVLDHFRDRENRTNAFSAVLKSLTLADFTTAETLLLCAGILGAVVVLWRFRSAGDSISDSAMSAILCGAGISGYLFVSGHLIASDLAAYKTPTPEFVCAKHFRPLIAEHAIILASGGICGDQLGHKAASDAPEMFYWLDRKGFSICTDAQTIPNVISIAKQGASYFVAEKSAVDAKPGFEAELKQHFKLLAECDDGWLFDLRQP